jgi:hypothetical protein
MPEPIIEVPLRDHLEMVIAAQDKLWSMQLKETQKAIDLARENMGHRLNELNELRKDVLADRDQFVTKAVFEPFMRDRDIWRGEMSERLTKLETERNTGGKTWQLAFGAFVTIVNIALIIYFRKT